MEGEEHGRGEGGTLLRGRPWVTEHKGDVSMVRNEEDDVRVGGAGGGPGPSPNEEGATVGRTKSGSETCP